MAGLLFVSCEGKQGEVGPAGQKGDSGAPGPTGPKGDIGSANVVYTEWLPIPAKATASWPNRKNFSFAAPKITKEVLDNGLVYAYVKTASVTVPLPYTVVYGYIINTNQATTYGTFMNTVLLAEGSLSFNQDWITPNTPPDVFANSTSVVGNFTHLRYIIIPGGQKARVVGLDYNNYEAVKAHYGWVD
jgi:hypothetical protein